VLVVVVVVMVMTVQHCLVVALFPVSFYLTGLKWADVNARVYGALREMFAAVAVGASPPIHHVQCRAEYGVDVMVDQDLQPYILEATLSPDTTRANKYTPTYTNDVLGTLMFGEGDNPRSIRLA
jgi:hypothetical protein